MIKRCVVKAVSKFKGLLVDDDKAWFNVVKESKSFIPDDLHQFIGKEISLSVVDGVDHKYDGFSVVSGEGGEKAQPNGDSSPPDRDVRIGRMAALNSSLKAIEVCGWDVADPESVVKVAKELAEDIIEWVNRK